MNVELTPKEWIRMAESAISLRRGRIASLLTKSRPFVYKGIEMVPTEKFKLKCLEGIAKEMNEEIKWLMIKVCEKHGKR